MRQSLKISLSLLISLALFAGVAVLSFSGLFNYLQTAFFQPRVLAERGQAVTRLAVAVERYHLRNLERIASLLAEPFIASAFSSTGQQSREDIFNRGNLFGRLLEEYPYLQGVRLLDPDGRRIHFSTYRGDTQVAPDKQKVTYLNLAEAEKGLAGGELATPAGQAARLLIDATGGRLIYSQAVLDAGGAYRGSALFFFLKKDLEAALLREPEQDIREIALIGRLGLVANLAAADRDIAAPAVSESWRQRAATELSKVSKDTLVFEGAQQSKEKYILLSLPAGRFGLVGLLVPNSALELKPLKWRLIWIQGK